MRRMVIFLLLLLLFLSGCSSSPVQETPLEAENSHPEINAEEMKKVELYTTVMKAAFEIENGGNSFIAIKLDSLEGLSRRAQEIVLDNFTDLCPHVYSYEEIKDDPTKIEWYNSSFPNRAIDGTVLSVDLKEYGNDTAQIEAVSWFGSLGAVLPTYEAKYVNNHWELKLISFAVA